MPGKVGNKNALKHGLYAKRLQTPDGKTAAGLSYSNLIGEIAYLRVVIARITDILESNGLADKSKQALSDQTIKTLNSYLNAIERLTTIVRTHALLSGGMSEIEKQIEDGLFLARDYFGVYEYLKNPQPAPSPKQKPNKKG